MDHLVSLHLIIMHACMLILTILIRSLKNFANPGRACTNFVFQADHAYDKERNCIIFLGSCARRVMPAWFGNFRLSIGNLTHGHLHLMA